MVNGRVDRLQSMRVFRAVVDEGAFARAARRLRLSKAAVSKHVGALEEALATRLLHRTTRSLSLTADGRAYYDRATALLDEIEALEQEMREGSEAPRGTLRIAAPLSFGLTHLSPMLPAFLEAHPEVRVDLALTDRFVDVVEEGVDVAIRVARSLADSSLIARRLAEASRVLVASPAYLQRRGTPDSPEQLTDHACLRYTGMRDPDVWRFRDAEGEELAVAVDGPLDADNSLALRPALLAGLGLTLTPRFVVAEALADGRLVTCLEHWAVDPATVWGVYPARRHRSAKLRAFLAFAENELSVA